MRVPVLGHLMRATDRVLDVLHGVYERLIHWIFSDRRYRCWCRRCRPTASRSTRRRARPGRAAALAPGDASRRAASWCWPASAASSRAIALAPLVGTEFIPETRRQLHPHERALPVGTSLERGSEKMRQVEEVVREMPEIRMVSTTIGDTGSGSRNSAPLSIQLVKPQRAQAAARSEVEKAIRKALEPIPGIEVSLGNRPIYVALLGPDPAVLEAEVLEAAGEGRQGARHRRPGRPRSSPACRPTRCASSPTPCASSA